MPFTVRAPSADTVFVKVQTNWKVLDARHFRRFFVDYTNPVPLQIRLNLSFCEGVSVESRRYKQNI